jgi:glyoxalase family protein
MRTLRISHPAFFGIHSTETIRFYSGILNMPIVLRQPNLDDASMEHVFFHVGEDNFIAYFLPYDEAAAAARYERMKPGYGVMNHLALDVDAHSFAAAVERLQAEGVQVSGPVERGYERSIYFRDPNGVRLELLTWLTPPPPGLAQADIIAQAQRIRQERGAEFVEDRDVR